MARKREKLGTGLAVVALVSLASPAQADVIVAPDGTRQSVERHRGLVVHQGSTEVLIESLAVQSTVGRALWIKPFPSAPELADAGETPFVELDRSTDVPEPHNESIRRRVFGPSIVTLLTQRLLGDDEDGPAGPAEKETDRDLKIVDREVFSGTVYTSTITLEYMLPEPMQLWLQSRGFRLQEQLKGDLAAHLNRGAYVSVAVVEDPKPGRAGLAKLGPIRTSLSAKNAVFPTLRRTDPGAGRTRYELYVVGAKPLVPSSYSTLWDEEPWTPKPLGRGQFQTRYAHPVGDTDALTLDLEQRQGIALPATAYLIRSEFRQGNEALGEIYFEPGPHVVQIPGSGRQGSGKDLFLCILLGLTPLIYTPESWFLLWLGGRARERLHKGEKAFGARLWPLFALAVAVYWAVNLEGAARLAAVLPFLVAVGMLVLPDGFRRSTRVRVDFGRRKKAKQ